jgi:hypothetical protein
MTIIVDWWRGEERLWKPFWLGGVLGGIVVQIISQILGMGGLPLGVVGFVLVLVYEVWILVAIWNCAFNVDWNGWGYIVRVMVILQAATIVIGGLTLAGVFATMG